MIGKEYALSLSAEGVLRRIVEQLARPQHEVVFSNVGATLSSACWKRGEKENPYSGTGRKAENLSIGKVNAFRGTFQFVEEQDSRGRCKNRRPVHT